MKMNRHWWWVLGPVAFAAFLAVGGWVVMALWNWLLPPLFGWKLIGFWQALGLLALSRILFGNWGGKHHHDWKARHEWKHAFTPEEKARFREEMRKRWFCEGEAEKKESSPQH
jgi:hypothetical protein